MGNIKLSLRVFLLRVDVLRWLLLDSVEGEDGTSSASSMFKGLERQFPEIAGFPHRFL